MARAPFLSGFARLLRCRKDLGQLAEVLGGGGEQEFIFCTTLTVSPQPHQTMDAFKVCEDHVSRFSTPHLAGGRLVAGYL